MLQDDIEIHGENHDRPPRGIHAEIGGGKRSSRKIILHDGMYLLAVSAALAMPTNEFIARHPRTIGHYAEEFVAAGGSKLHGLKRELRLFRSKEKLQLAQGFANGEKTIFPRTFATASDPIRNEGDFRVLLSNVFELHADRTIRLLVHFFA